MLQWEKVLKSIRRCQGRIVGVRSTEQSVGIKVGGFCPRHLLRIGKWIPKKLELITRSSSTGSAGRTEGEERNWTEQYYFLI